MHNRFEREDIRRRMSQRGFGQDRGWEHQGAQTRGGQWRENDAYDDDDRYGQEQGYEGGDYESGRQRSEEQGRRFMRETGAMRRYDSDRQSGYRGGAADDDPRWQYGGGIERGQYESRSSWGQRGAEGRYEEPSEPFYRSQGSYGSRGNYRSQRDLGSQGDYSSEQPDWRGGWGESSGGQGSERSGWRGGDINDRGGFGGARQRGFGGYAGSGSYQGGRGQGGFGGGQHAGRGPSDYRRNDERIREDVCDDLTDDSHLDATHIQVKVENGEVTLSGTVTNRDQKRRAEDIAEGARGVSDVRNELRVQSESQSQSGSPDWPQPSKAGTSQKNF